MLRRPVMFLLISLFTFSVLDCQSEKKVEEKPGSQSLSKEQLQEKAKKLAHELMIIDTHIDVPYRLNEKMEDISVRTARGDFDYPRAREGGLDVAFMSIYVPASLEKSGGSKKLAERLIAMVGKLASDHPDKFVVVRSVAEVKEQFGKGRVSFPMGMENGSPLEGNLRNVKYFYDKGIRYITLAHSKNNHICDSSFDEERKWHGLSPFGKEVVEEMNKVGMMVDVSHISDSAFYQVMRVSRAPVIASHSSCRHFTPGWERNMSDEMIKLLAEKGGVIHINFGSAFLKDDIRKKGMGRMFHIENYLKENNLTREDPVAKAYIEEYRKKTQSDFADISDVVAHIDHVVKLVGADYVGLGSDFDGVGDSLPVGLKDVSYYPNLIYELLSLGYSDNDIEKICSGNLLRVWSEVEYVAKEMQSK